MKILLCLWRRSCDVMALLIRTRIRSKTLMPVAEFMGPLPGCWPKHPRYKTVPYLAHFHKCTFS